VPVALGAEATFVARTLDSDRKHLTMTLQAAAEHRGTAFVEIMQNCDIYNDGAFDVLKEADGRDEAVVWLEGGEPVRFGKDGSKGVRVSARGSLEVVDVDSVGVDQLLVHDPQANEPELAFALSRLGNVDRGVTPLGIFRAVTRTAYDDAARAQVDLARESRGDGDLAKLLTSGHTWRID
jgi:2-oxoglutarate ferredoxin oxidoreductase subunit beta